MSKTMNNVINVEWTLTVVFVILKLTGIITWSWWWLVGFCFVYPLILVLIILTVGLVVVTVMFCNELLKFLHKMLFGK